MKNFLYFDSAATTPCSPVALEGFIQYASEDFGNPSSTHILGMRAAQAIREARKFFAQTFAVEPKQVIFTGSGTEANNLAITGTVFAPRKTAGTHSSHPQVLFSSVEHAAVRNTANALISRGLRVESVAIHPSTHTPNFGPQQLSEDLRLVSIQTVNNIVGTVFNVDQIATDLKAQYPHIVFHTDAIQAFGKIQVSTARSQVDLLSISAHKIGGPKGMGALIVLNPALLTQLTPCIWGGGQEHGFRSGTESPGLIVGFSRAAQAAISNLNENLKKIRTLRDEFKKELFQLNLLTHTGTGPLRWNSSENSSPYIINLSVPGYPSSPFAMMLEERKCLVSVGSACNSNKPTADPVLEALGFAKNIQSSAFRVSLSVALTKENMITLAHAMKDALTQMTRLAGKR